MDDWREPKERLCRVCGTEEETIEHMLETCCPAEGEENVLEEDGRGLGWMSGVLGSRPEVEKKKEK